MVKLEISVFLSMLFCIILLAQAQSQGTKTPGLKPYTKDDHTVLAAKGREVTWTSSSTKLRKTMPLKFLQENPCGEDVPCENDVICERLDLKCKCEKDDDDDEEEEGTCILPDQCLLQTGCSTDDDCNSPPDQVCKCGEEHNCYDELITAED